jgi:hypothetical protein
VSQDPREVSERLGLVETKTVGETVKNDYDPLLYAKKSCTTCWGRGVVRRAKGRDYSNELVFSEVPCSCVLRKQRRMMERAR